MYIVLKDFNEIESYRSTHENQGGTKSFKEVNGIGMISDDSFTKSDLDIFEQSGHEVLSVEQARVYDFGVIGEANETI